MERHLATTEFLCSNVAKNTPHDDYNMATNIPRLCGGNPQVKVGEATEWWLAYDQRHQKPLRFRLASGPLTSLPGTKSHMKFTYDSVIYF